MARRRDESWITLMAKRVLYGWLACVLAVVATLVGMDRHRKRRNPPSSAFPHVPPREQPIGSSTATTFTFGEDVYAEMLAAIAGAKRQILLESYIWKSDELGQRFKDAIVEASRRGVEVFVVFDGFANLVVRPSFKSFPPPIHVLRYPVLQPGLLLLQVRKSGRDHRKILVVDGEVGFVGGYNIGTLYATQWRDTHLRLEGPAVWELQNAFVDFWNDHRDKKTQPRLPDPGSRTWEPQIRVHRNSPAALLFPVRGLYLEAIDRACDHVWLTQAYFIPDRDILEGLLAAARRGVDVRVIVPEYSNHVVTDWLSRGFYTTLLRGNVRILLFQNAMVHAKTATVDGEWTTIGTANIDRLSLTGNYEVNIEVFDDELARTMDEIFESDAGNTRELTLEEWESRTVVARFSELVLKPLRPLL